MYLGSVIIFTETYTILKSFCTAKGNINKIKTQSTEWKNIFTNISEKRLISKVFKELTKLNTQKIQTTQLKNGQWT